MADLELLDCGDGRRLERFGDVIVDRPAPTATLDRHLPPSAWAKPTLRWAKSAWVIGGAKEPWPVRVGGLTLECRAAGGGQVGVFPEHAATWAWLDKSVRDATVKLGRQPRVLSLFAYTGGSTLACARAGAAVAHVDSSRPALGWARRNAELSGLADAPIRWLVDDARTFVQRERRRGQTYDGVVLDPPTYGHGKGAWEIDDHLPALLVDIAAIVGPRPSFIVLSAHTPGYDGERLAALIREHILVSGHGEALVTRSRAGATLALGAWARGPHR